MKREIGEIEKDLKDCIDGQKALSARRGILEKERLAVLRGTQFYCPDCGRKSTLSKWVFIQTSHYERPYGCGGGDTWHKRGPNECGIRHKCGGVFHIPKLINGKRLLKIMEKVGPAQAPKLFGSVLDLEEKDLLRMCRR